MPWDRCHPRQECVMWNIWAFWGQDSGSKGEETDEKKEALVAKKPLLLIIPSSLYLTNGFAREVRKEKKEKKGFRYETIFLRNKNSPPFSSVSSQVVKAYERCM